VSSQHVARDALRAVWSELVDASLLPALISAQTQTAAEAVVTAVWPTMRLEDMVRLDEAERNFLLRGNTIPADFLPCLQKQIAVIADRAVVVTTQYSLQTSRSEKPGRIVREGKTKSAMPG
jgi:hypothetical protein